MSSKVIEKIIGFIGAGQMATALAKGFVNGNVAKRENIILSGPVAATLEEFKKHGYMVTTDNRIVVEKAEIVICAVKPYVVKEVLDEVYDNWTESKIFISICAGIPLSFYKRLIPRNIKIIRLMPNTCCLVGASASAYCCSEEVEEEEKKIIEILMSSCGKILNVTEEQLDAVTGVSGSGPAYIYMAIEALSDGGVKNGLPRTIATTLAAQTVYGSAEMVLKTGLNPAILKEQVTTPAGTTIAAIAALEQKGFRSAILNAVDAAVYRAKEIAKQYSLDN